MMDDTGGGGDPGGGQNIGPPPSPSYPPGLDPDQIMADADAATDGMDVAGSPQLQIAEEQLESGELTPEPENSGDDDVSRHSSGSFDLLDFWNKLSSEEGRLAAIALAEKSPSFVAQLSELVMSNLTPQTDQLRQTIEVS
jgi:hypothetical protein